MIVVGIDPRSPMIPTMPLSLADRFWPKVDRRSPDQCWPWTGSRQAGGYGRIRVGDRPDGAHRVSWRLAHGQPVPDGQQIDHLCRNPPCVNPAHLEAVTPQINSSRSTAGAVNAARQRAITHCPAGHPYDEPNTHVKPNGSRSCRACARAYAQQRRDSARAAS